VLNGELATVPLTAPGNLVLMRNGLETG
jgi:hypothetical protein